MKGGREFRQPARKSSLSLRRDGAEREGKLTPGPARGGECRGARRGPAPARGRPGARAALLPPLPQTPPCPAPGRVPRAREESPGQRMRVLAPRPGALGAAEDPPPPLSPAACPALHRSWEGCYPRGWSRVMLATSAIVGALLEKIRAGSGGCRAAGYAVLGLSGAAVAFLPKI